MTQNLLPKIPPFVYVGILFIAVAVMIIASLPKPVPETIAIKQISLNELLKEPAQSPFLTSPEPQLAGNMRITAIVTRKASILGRAGFSPAVIKAQAGDIIVWTNNDIEHRTVEMVFEKINSSDPARRFITTKTISYQSQYQGIFEEGIYDYWTVGYGTKGRIVVKDN